MVRNVAKPRRRAGAKVSRKPKMRQSRKFSSAWVKKNWNHHKTARQNLHDMGIVVTNNNYKSIARSLGKEGAELAQIADLRMARDGGIIVEHHKRRSPNHVSEEEMWYLERLQQKHGDNFKAMERDLRLNFKQLTATRLEKLSNKMALYKKELEAEKEREATAEGTGDEAHETLAEDDEDEDVDEEREKKHPAKTTKKKKRRGPVKS